LEEFAVHYVVEIVVGCADAYVVFIDDVDVFDSISDDDVQIIGVIISEYDKNRGDVLDDVLGISSDEVVFFFNYRDFDVCVIFFKFIGDFKEIV
jgi:hypothetical protein